MIKLQEVIEQYYNEVVLPRWQQLTESNPGVGQVRLINTLSVESGVGPKVLKKLIAAYENNVPRD